jgi:hypothetical protein
VFRTVGYGIAAFAVLQIIRKRRAAARESEGIDLEIEV